MNADNTEILDRYPGIRPFSKGQSILFYGRNAELNELLNSVKAYSLFVLHSKSGLGKTSLLNAGLMPMLEREGFLPVEIRFRFTNISKDDKIEIPDPFKVIEEACKAVSVEDAINAIKPQYKTLWIYLKLLKDRHKTPVLVFDHFEEFFSHPDKARKEQIIMQFAELLNDRPPSYVFDFIKDHKDIVGGNESFFLEPCPVHLLISIRSDKLALLDEMKTLIPSITNKRFQLNPLFAAQAKQAILLPASLINFGNHRFRKAPFEYDNKALDTILKVLQDRSNAGEIESTQLQIICQSIEKKMRDANGSLEEITVTENTFDGEDGLQRILKNFYDDQLTALSEMPGITFYDIERVRDMIETKMIFEEMRVGLLKKQVINNLQDFETLNDDAERTKKAEFIIGALTDLRIIRSEETYLGVTYIITHDTLIHPIMESHKQDLEKKEQSAQQSFNKVVNQIDNFADVDGDLAVAFMANKMVVDGKPKLLTEAEIIAGLAPSGLDEARTKKLISDGYRKNFFRPGQIDCAIGYQLSNERLVDLVESEHFTRKTINDNQRLKEEKEKLEKLTAEKEKAERSNRRLVTVIGVGLFVLLIGAVIASVKFKLQSDHNQNILAKNLNYEGERSYNAGYQILAYALWQQALEYIPGDTIIQANLNRNRYYPYLGAAVDVSEDQQYVATRNGNRVNIWKDGEDVTTLVLSRDNILRYAFIPNTHHIFFHDTAGRISFFDLATGQALHYKNDAIDLDVARLRNDITDVTFSPVYVRARVAFQSYLRLFYFWNHSGQYLENISKFCNETDSLSYLSPSDSYPLDDNKLILERSGMFYLLDFQDDVVTKLGTYQKGFVLNSVTKLSNGLYSLLLMEDAGTRVRVLLFSPEKKTWVYRTPILANEPIVTATRIIDVSNKGLRVFSAPDTTAQVILFPHSFTYWRTSVFGDTVLYVGMNHVPTNKFNLFTLPPGNRLTTKEMTAPGMILSRSLTKNYFVYNTDKKNLYLYDIKRDSMVQLDQDVEAFVNYNDILSMSPEPGYGFEINTWKKVESYSTVMPPKFISQVRDNTRLLYLDSTKNDINSLLRRYQLFIDQRFDSLGLPKRELQHPVSKAK